MTQTSGGTTRPAGALAGKRVVVIGRGGGIARAVARRAIAAGAQVTVAGRDAVALATAYANDDVDVEQIDVTDEDSIARLAARLADHGRIDHVVTTASARARGTYDGLTPEAILSSLQTKVVGTILLAKHFAPTMAADGSIVALSGSTALKPSPGMVAVAATNAALNTAVAGLAIELAPIRVNAISPGTIDTGAYDALGDERKAQMFARKSATNPSRRIGVAEDVADAVLFALTNTFMTGVALPIDGGEPLI
jgi:NAD(P)-dependent dehydrogenase (short-subunit alcohol dehydrogenase family)